MTIKYDGIEFDTVEELFKYRQLEKGSNKTSPAPEPEKAPQTTVTTDDYPDIDTLRPVTTPKRLPIIRKQRRTKHDYDSMRLEIRKHLQNGEFHTIPEWCDICGVSRTSGSVIPKMTKIITSEYDALGGSGENPPVVRREYISTKRNRFDWDEVEAKINTNDGYPKTIDDWLIIAGVNEDTNYTRHRVTEIIKRVKGKGMIKDYGKWKNKGKGFTDEHKAQLRERINWINNRAKQICANDPRCSFEKARAMAGQQWKARKTAPMTIFEDMTDTAQSVLMNTLSWLTKSKGVTFSFKLTDNLQLKQGNNWTKARWEQLITAICSKLVQIAKELGVKSDDFKVGMSGETSIIYYVGPQK